MKRPKGTAPKRRLVLIDIENYCGKSIISQEDVAKVKTKIKSQPTAGPDDLFIIASSHESNFFSTKRSWAGGEHVFRKGHNGADIALIDAAKRHLPNINSFREVSLFSGDGIFTNLIKECGELGVTTTVVALENQINRSLASAASFVRLEEPALYSV